tara:strand:+ start:27075 stop:27881 length:807 start_codon:yes stop_codon:yes gene_type:complete
MKVKWIKRKEHAFFLGFIYSMVALVSASLIFPKSIGLMSVAFTSILLIPSLNVLLAQEENQEVRQKKLSLKLLWRDHNDILKVYIYMFLGVFAAFLLISLFYNQALVTQRFSSQLSAAGIHGSAIDFYGKFSQIVQNNLLIFIVCFMLSLVYGAGAVLFLTWNASVWGIVFGFFTRFTINEGAGTNPISTFFSKITPFLPHMTTEALAYVIAAIMGGIMSKAIIREKWGSKKFNHILTDALLVLGLGVAVVIVAAYLEVYVYAKILTG